MTYLKIVTCGRCCENLVHKKGVSSLQCPICNFYSDICDFPDLFIEKNEVDERGDNINDIITDLELAKSFT